MKSLVVYNWCVKITQCGYMKHGWEHITFYVQKHITPLLICYNPPLFATSRQERPYLWDLSIAEVESKQRLCEQTMGSPYSGAIVRTSRDSLKPIPSNEQFTGSVSPDFLSPQLRIQASGRSYQQNLSYCSGNPLIYICGTQGGGGIHFSTPWKIKSDVRKSRGFLFFITFYMELKPEWSFYDQ